MFAQLSKIVEKPEIYSRYTADVLWTNEHLAKRMLETHLSQETPLASRVTQDIERTVHSLHNTFNFSGKKVCDLGCGPGLYAEKIALLGGSVTGIDFSKNSINYAIQSALSCGLNIQYHVGNYLENCLPENQDIVTLVYFDLCVLSPVQRKALYKNIHTCLSKGGLFIFDVLSAPMYAEVKEVSCIEANYMGGFWSDKDYITIHKTHRYDDYKTSLDHFAIFEEGKHWEIFNWFKYFEFDEIAQELSENGFQIDMELEPFSKDDNSNSLAIASRRK